MILFYPQGKAKTRDYRMLNRSLMLLCFILISLLPSLLPSMLPLLMRGNRWRGGVKFGFVVLAYLPVLVLLLRVRVHKRASDPKVRIYTLNSQNQLHVLPLQSFYGSEVEEAQVRKIIEDGYLQYGTMPRGTGEILRTLNVWCFRGRYYARCMVRVNDRIRVMILKFDNSFKNYQLLDEQFHLRIQ